MPDYYVQATTPRGKVLHWFVVAVPHDAISFEDFHGHDLAVATVKRAGYEWQHCFRGDGGHELPDNPKRLEYDGKGVEGLWDHDTPIRGLRWRVR